MYHGIFCFNSTQERRRGGENCNTKNTLFYYIVRVKRNDDQAKQLYIFFRDYYIF
jgi:hypothetical protein